MFASPVRCTILAIAFAAAIASLSSAQETSLFERLDADGDGRVTRDEVGQDRQRLFERMLRTSDWDADGALTRSELGDALGPQPGGADRGRPEFSRPQFMQLPPGGRLMLVLDRDRDGELSAAEIEMVSASLKRLDADGDGRLTGREFGAPPAAPNVNLRSNSSMVARDRYRRIFARLDENGDGQISRSETPQYLRRDFDAVDGDNDGALNGAELVRLFARFAGDMQPGGGNDAELQRRVDRLRQRLDRPENQ